MTRRLQNSLNEFRQVDVPLEISGTLGIAIGGQRTVEVPNRAGFVYVKLRDNQNELIQALNDKVSPVYGLPVIVVRDGNRYTIKGRDTQRYTDWQSYSPFLPRHGDQHSFNQSGGGGDVVWVYGRQFMPMLIIPSGSLGGPNVIVSEYVLQDATGNWKYVGNTGTQSLAPYIPTNTNGVMVLVYVDQTTGNPGIIVNSGSTFSNVLTGTSQIVPYLPALPNANYLPDFAVRLVSGTSSIGWNNLYDIRQYYHSVIATGSAGGGLSSIPVQDEGIPQGNATTFNFVGAGVVASISGSVAQVNIPGGGTSSGVYKNPGSVLFAGSDGYPDEDNLRLYWDNTNKIFRVGPLSPTALLTSSTINNQNVAVNPNTAATYAAMTYGTGTSGSPAPVFAGYRMRGTPSAPAPVQNNDSLQLMVGAGYDGANFINSARIRSSAQGSWVTGTYTGSIVEVDVTPSGTNSRAVRLQVVGNGTNIPDGTYMISGSPHQHPEERGLYQSSGTTIPNDGWILEPHAWTFSNADAPSYVVSVNANLTGTMGLGTKIQLTHQSTTKNFILTAFNGVTGSTTWLNLYGGTDYTLNVTGSITDPKYSLIKAPVGFPLNQTKWTTFVSVAGDNTQTTPTINTWYQPGSVSLDIPIGVWLIQFSFHMAVVSNAAQTVVTVQAAISTSTGSVSDTDLLMHKAWSGAAGTIIDSLSGFAEKYITLASKTTYYAIIRTTVNNIATIGFYGTTVRPTKISVVSAYL